MQQEKKMPYIPTELTYQEQKAFESQVKLDQDKELKDRNRQARHAELPGPVSKSDGWPTVPDAAALARLQLLWVSYERDQARLVAAQQQHQQAHQVRQSSEQAWNEAFKTCQVEFHAEGHGIDFVSGTWIKPKE